MSFLYWLVFVLFNILVSIKDVNSSYHEEQLFKELFQNYNPLIRPVRKVEETIVVSFSIALLQLISVVEKEQVLKTNVWLQVKWKDYQMQWKPEKYGGILSIRIPPSQVWTPDIVLFNNADGKYEASYKSNVVVYSDGSMTWVPPAIYKSSCYIDVKFFPFDEQTCELRFGSWTYDQQQMNFSYYDEKERNITIKDYVVSGSWDLLDGPMSIQQSSYTPSVTNETDGSSTVASITSARLEKADGRDRVEFVCKLLIKRKTLFYTVNLIIPTVLISFLSVFVFYLPTDAGEKMTLSISILLALVVFLLLISKILPPTSIVIPLIAKYLLFTFMMNIITIFFTVVIINYNYRTSRTHKMPNWIKHLCIDILPRILRMERPKKYEKEDNIHVTEADRAKQTMLNYMQASRALSIASPPVTINNNSNNSTTNHYDQPLELKKRHSSKKKHQHHHHHHHRHSSKRHQQTMNQSSTTDDEENPLTPQDVDLLLTKEAYEAAEDLSFIANYMRSASHYEEVRDDWKYIASVIDRLQLFIFFAVTAFGTLKILFNAPGILKVVDQCAILRKWDPSFNNATCAY
ncbi:unnamed protein product [Adineta steineri]|uniref:Uncharacterized protein n=2 Tax=Adineta steineri TaxID=433720 RepID=A0A815M7B6_9BILA|nr:unnamed protein product [Adineta steineri]CAF1247916.1 unnamed protein product [Adineta steineri]CAF1420629.1 unnamed protein product [Adineta steineri]CAF3622112.1 unnamed protein product [Adineta steineri]CAF3853843.1 unnamed protein product [Adineta steineri]